MHAQLQKDRAFRVTPEGWGFVYRRSESPTKPGRRRSVGVGGRWLEAFLVRWVLRPITTGSVLLQSGYRTQDQKTPCLPVRCRIGEPHRGQAGASSSSIDNVSCACCCTSRETQAACLPTKASSVICPTQI